MAPSFPSASIARTPPLVSGRRRIVAAMSGGVDSAVAAALLKAEGHEVIGVTMQLYDHGHATGRRGSCCAGQDIHDARRAADHLGIPHYVLDFERRFDAAVIQSFADSYLAGETPVPCIACNAQIKFKDLLETAADLGADLMATGHYIARRDDTDGAQLFRAADAERDQSYFLFATTHQQIDQLCFPLGELRKTEVRAIAAEIGLPVADKPDSQDICFVPSGRYTDVIARIRPEAARPGQIVHVDGRVLGRHEGITHFTIGQRRGINVGSPEPLFVVRIDPASRTVYVGPREALVTGALALRDVNWLGGRGVPGGPVELYVRLRSQQMPQPATLHMLRDGRGIVELVAGENGVAAGQACVFYADGAPRARILGGGWIAHTAARSTALAGVPSAKIAAPAGADEV